MSVCSASKRKDELGEQLERSNRDAERVDEQAMSRKEGITIMWREGDGRVRSFDEPGRDG